MASKRRHQDDNLNRMGDRATAINIALRAEQARASGIAEYSTPADHASSEWIPMNPLFQLVRSDPDRAAWSSPRGDSRHDVNTDETKRSRQQHQQDKTQRKQRGKRGGARQHRRDKSGDKGKKPARPGVYGPRDFGAWGMIQDPRYARPGAWATELQLRPELLAVCPLVVVDTDVPWRPRTEVIELTHISPVGVLCTLRGVELLWWASLGNETVARCLPKAFQSEAHLQAHRLKLV